MTTTTLRTVSTSSRSALTTRPLAPVATSPSQTAATHLVQKPGTVGSSPRSSNPPQGFAGPSPTLPGVNRPNADSLAPTPNSDKQATINQTLGLVSQSAAVQTLTGIGTGTNAMQSEREKLTDLQESTPSNRPAFSQGYSDQPVSLGSNPVASRPSTAPNSQGTPSTGAGGGGASFGGGGGSSGSPNSVSTSGGTGGAVFNPMDQFRAGSVGGPLAAAAGAGTKTLADFNRSSMIADGDLAPSPLTTAGAAGTAVQTATAASQPTTALISAVARGTTAGVGTLGGATMTGLWAGGAGAVATAGLGVAAAFTAGAGIGSFLNNVFTAVVGKTLGDVIYDGANPDDSQPASTSTTGGGAGIPNPETSGSSINVLSQSLLNQLQAAQAGRPSSQGGNGDVRPTADGGSDPVVRTGTIASNQASLQGRNLFGQPAHTGLDTISGGNKGINTFNGTNGAGTINPGADAVGPAGDPRFQQDPANALGDRTPTAPPPSLNTSEGTSQSSPSKQSSGVSTTLAAGLSNLTLTGTAAINGTGNALANSIQGNNASNQLRGLAGNDNLNGQGGNDLLEGGSGRDQLTGGTGADRFVFASSGGFGTTQADRITDFNRSGGDRIEISRTAFGLSSSAAVSLRTVSSDTALSQALASTTLLIQDLRDGSLLFNQNGAAAGAGQGGLFAQMTPGLTLQSSDVLLIA